MFDRLIRWVVYLIRWLILQVSLVIRFTLPLLARFAFRAMQLVGFAFVMWFRNLWTAIGQLATLLQKDDVYLRPGPSNLEPLFRVLAYLVVIGELVAGWILAAYLTVYGIDLLIWLIF